MSHEQKITRSHIGDMLICLKCRNLCLFTVEEIDAPIINAPEVYEQIVKSPPEPTRVKSPEQIVIMRSPDPVFWTVPLDTGKTFTVTQNVREGGDLGSIVRPHSEIKVSTPLEAPARLLPQMHPQSAPPELSEQDDLHCENYEETLKHELLIFS